MCVYKLAWISLNISGQSMNKVLKGLVWTLTNKSKFPQHIIGGYYKKIDYLKSESVDCIEVVVMLNWTISYQ